MANKDWKGNSNSIYKTLGASNHTEEERETNDYYATEPKAVKLLLELEKFSYNIWEPACGELSLSNEIKSHGYNVRSSDLIVRCKDVEQLDFLLYEGKWYNDIITNPPYSKASEFIEKCMEITKEGNKIAMFLKVQFMEGKARKKLFEKYPPKIIYVSSSRLLCAKNGAFEEFRKQGSAVCYAWYIFEKGYNGDTILKWFN
jgi:hypothetical protein